VFGVTFAMFLTLFVVPAVYAIVARRSHSPEHVSRLVQKLREQSATREPAPELHTDQPQS